jgi:hypothetical protein
LGTEQPLVLRVRADCRGHLFTAKLAVVVHNLVHQLLNHLLADGAVLLACEFCDRLGDRVDDFIGFIGIDFVRALLSRGIRRRNRRSVRPSRSEGRGAPKQHLALLTWWAPFDLQLAFTSAMPVVPSRIALEGIVRSLAWAEIRRNSHCWITPNYCWTTLKVTADIVRT